MRLRLELFVDDLAVSAAFYREVLGFGLVRRSEDYLSLRRGGVVLGLGPVTKLPVDGAFARPSRSGRGAGGHGADGDRADGAGSGGYGSGVEIVLELDDVSSVEALHRHCVARGVVVSPLREQSWGLWDFRVSDPDGYYLRITHGDAATSG